MQGNSGFDSVKPSTATSVPPLENGDRLTRSEFERRYAASGIKKAELIEGLVYVASPLRYRLHGRPHSQILTWLGLYQALTAGTELGVEPTLRLDLENETQPDAVLFIQQMLGGKARIDEEDYLTGSPELIVEIAASSASIDLGNKKNAYCRNGVQEYLVWQTYENQLNWFVLEAGEYRKLQPDAAGLIKSRVFPGLWLAVEALLSNQMPEVLIALQRGMDSSEYHNFLKGLQS